jgi:hypothetical protein
VSSYWAASASTVSRYVVSELPHVGRRFALREVAMWGVFLGFLAGYGMDLILTWGGA